MTNSMKAIAAALLAVFFAASTTDAVRADEPVWTSGEVRKVDVELGKVTVRHEEIANLDMPPMTMIFTVSDPALLTGLAVGDTREFYFIDQNGRMVIDQIRTPE